MIKSRLMAPLLILSLLLPSLAPFGMATAQESPEFEARLDSFSSQNFPFIFLNVSVLENGTVITDLPQESFHCSENGVVQTDYFSVTPPSAGGGVRLADVVFLIDTSGSMGAEIAAVRANVNSFAQQLAGSDVDFRLGLVRFGNSSGPNPFLFNEGNLTDDVALFQSFVSTLYASGSYEPGFLALRMAVQNFNFRPGSQKIFILITDEDSDDRDKATTIDLLLANDVTVHTAVSCTAGYSEGDYCNDTSVRGVTGGLLFDVIGPYDEILDTIATQTAYSYVLRYRSSNPDFDGTARNVECTVVKDGLSDTVSASYIPGAEPRIELTDVTKQLNTTALAEGTRPIIQARVTDQVEPFVQQVTVYSRHTGASSYTALIMTPIGDNLYEATLPAVATPGVDYYLRATDGQLSSSLPSTDPANYPFQIAVLPNVAPSIDHTPVESALPNTDLKIGATVVDTTNLLASVELFWRHTGELLYSSQEIVSASGDYFETTLPAGQLSADVEYYIRAVDDLDVSTTHGTPDNPHSISVQSGSYAIRGSVSFDKDKPLRAVKIALSVEGQQIAATSADSSGGFRFENIWAQSSDHYSLTVYLIDGLAQDLSDSVIAVYYADGNSPVEAHSQDFAFSDVGSGETGAEHSLEFSKLVSASITEELLSDLAEIYFYASEALEYSRAVLGITFDYKLPLEISGYSAATTGAQYLPDTSTIQLSPSSSNFRITLADRTTVRHEFFHHVMNDTITTPPRHDGDSNHGGYSNHCTGDSWTEGWAEFWPCALQDHNGAILPFLYPLDFAALNLELNHEAWNPTSDFSLLLVENREEVAAASLLWDLYDGVNIIDQDNIDLTDVEIANLLTSTAVNSLRDMKDVYDALVAADIGQGTSWFSDLDDLDKLFVAHGFFADLDSDHRHDDDEEVGRAADGARPERRDIPLQPGMFLSLATVDAAGSPIIPDEYLVSFAFESPDDYYDYSYSVPGYLLADDLLYIEPPWTKWNVLVSITSVLEGNQSNTLVFSNDHFWNTYLHSIGEHLGEYTLSLGATEPIVLNSAPTVACGNDVTMFEGGVVTVDSCFLEDLDQDDTHSALVEWGDGSSDYVSVIEADGSGALGGAHTYADDGSFLVQATICDSRNACAKDSFLVSVGNTPPSITEIWTVLEPIEIGSSIDGIASYTDLGIMDTHTAVWDWGDGSSSAGVVEEENGSGTVTGSHVYNATGVYVVTLTVTDKDGDSTTATSSYVVVYDPNGGFVTGGGWISSPAGAYTPDPTLKGMATFGFVSKYLRGQTVPSGETEFHFETASNFKFHSEVYDWLVVSKDKAMFTGSGTLNGVEGFHFKLWAIDGDLIGSDGIDKFRIKIWYGDDEEGYIYDNQFGASDFVAPTTAVESGSIIIHGSNWKAH